MERSKEVEMSNVEKEDDSEYCSAHSEWEVKVSEPDENEAKEVDKEVGEVEDRNKFRREKLK